MNSLQIPKINRKFSKVFYFINTAVIYLITLPANWILTKLGFGPKMLALTIKIAEGPKGGKKAFQSYTPTSQDIFVSTFAKSGTNWIMQIAHQISFHGNGDFEHINDVVPWPDMSGCMIKSIPLESEQVQELSPEHMRVIKTHSAAYDIPYIEKAHYLTVVRDPKEIFVSSYYFGLGAYGPLMPELDAWFDLFFTKDFPFNFGNTWAEHTASYWALRDKPNVLILSFHKMKQDLQGVVQQVSNFLEVTLSPSELEQVIEKSSFSYMSKIDQRFIPMPKENTPWGNNLKMMREGKQGNSKELLSLEQQTLIDNHFKNELKKLDSDFLYDEFFNGKNT